MARWVLKPVELARAAKILGVKEPVSVKTYAHQWWGGEYDCEPLHVLWVNKNVENSWYDNPSWTIWHELAHAMQCERDFGGDGEVWKIATDKLYASFIDKNDEPILQDGESYEEWLERYFTMPLEREADDIAARYTDRHPLVRIIG